MQLTQALNDCPLGTARVGALYNERSCASTIDSFRLQTTSSSTLTLSLLWFNFRSVRDSRAAVEGKNGFVCMVERSWMSAFDSPEFWRL